MTQGGKTGAGHQVFAAAGGITAQVSTTTCAERRRCRTMAYDPLPHRLRASAQIDASSFSRVRRTTDHPPRPQPRIVCERQKMRERNEDCTVTFTPAPLHRRRGWIASKNATGGELERQLGWPVRHPLNQIPNLITRPPNVVASPSSGPKHRSARHQKPLAVRKEKSMSLATRIESLVIRVAQEFNDVRAKAGISPTRHHRAYQSGRRHQRTEGAVVSAVIDDTQVAATSTYSSTRYRHAARCAQGGNLGRCGRRLRHAGWKSAVAAKRHQRVRTPCWPPSDPRALRCRADADRARAGAGAAGAGGRQRCRQHRYRFRRGV